MAVPRGIKNNNPGNLILTSIAWQGKVPNAQNTDGHFEQFTSMAYGVRAMLKDLMGDINSGGLNTIRKLITQYAPAFENDTTNYINLVSSKTGIRPDAILTTDKATMLKIGSAITGVENGWSYMLPESEILKGWNMIGGIVETVKRNKKPIIATVAVASVIGGIIWYNQNSKSV